MKKVSVEMKSKKKELIADLKENEIRDYIYNEYKNNFCDLIINNKKPEENFKEFGIKYIIKSITDSRINRMIDSMVEIELIGQEVPLIKEQENSTRVDLIGHNTSSLFIIELKKTKNTEREALTQTLAYANYFSTEIFRSKNGITSVLIAPMESRITRDAYVQELLFNNSNTLALIPQYKENKITLEPFYPNLSYYRNFNNFILGDDFLSCIVHSFEEVDNYIDLKEINRKSNDYSVEALNSICMLIAQKMEEKNINGFVYSRQRYQAGIKFDYPNQIVVCCINPATLYNNTINKRMLKTMPSMDTYNLKFNVTTALYTIIGEAVKQSFYNIEKKSVNGEYNEPCWKNFKHSILELGVHNHNLYSTGLLREIYHKYLENIYDNGICEAYYRDGLPKYSYECFNKFLAFTEIINGISQIEGEGSSENMSA